MQFVAEVFEARTRQTHRNHCAELNRPLSVHFSTTSGLNRDSVLNRSTVFHVTEGVVMDAMHDVLEGSLRTGDEADVASLINHTNPPLFSLHDLNGQIRSFHYGHSDSKNQPSEIGAKRLGNEGSHNVGQSGKYSLSDSPVNQ